MAEKILVVDDDLDTLRLVGMMLEGQGYIILAASNGQQALNLARSEKPDLIVLDLMMPDIDGVQVARQLRADPQTQDILIVMFTAKTQMEEKLEGYEAGADDYLTKPIQPKELIAHVKAVLRRKTGVHTTSEINYSEEGHRIAFISAKGGVGVSTLAINTGIALHGLSKKSVIVTDFRPGCGSIGLELGITNAQGFNRLFALNPASISPPVIERELASHASGVKLLLSSPQPGEARHLNSVDHFHAICRQVAYLAHFVILDLGASLTPVNRKVLKECRQVVLVIEPIGQTVAQSRALYDLMVELGLPTGNILLALVNRQRAGMQLSLGQVQDQLGLKIGHVFTAAPELSYQAQVSNTPMILRQTDGVITQQVVSLAQRLLQNSR